MARYQDAVCRLCRREGMKLYLKGERCFKEKCSFETRKGKIPGQHGAAKAKKPTGYALQLREKQKVKRIYGVLEKQFSLYFQARRQQEGRDRPQPARPSWKAGWTTWCSGSGSAPSRAAARQMVMHGHILVNGKRVDIPSYQTKAGQSIEISARAQAERFREVLPGNRGRPRHSPVAHPRRQRLQGRGDRGSQPGRCASRHQRAADRRTLQQVRGQEC